MLPVGSQSQTIPCTPSDPPSSAVPQLACRLCNRTTASGKQDKLLKTGEILVVKNKYCKTAYCRQGVKIELCTLLETMWDEVIYPKTRYNCSTKGVQTIYFVK